MLFATYDTHLLMYAYIVYASEINNNLKRNKKKRNGIFTIDSPSQFLPYMKRHKFPNYLEYISGLLITSMHCLLQEY